jgi:hypothetical protein
MLTLKDPHDTVLTAPVSPTGINMRRVASMMTVIDSAKAMSDLIVASITVTGMALGLALPMHVFTAAWRRRHEL